MSCLINGHTDHLVHGNANQILQLGPHCNVKFLVAVSINKNSS